MEEWKSARITRWLASLSLALLPLNVLLHNHPQKLLLLSRICDFQQVDA